MAQLDCLSCDVCSEEISSQEDLMKHIQQHLSQLNRLTSKSLAHHFPEEDDYTNSNVKMGYSITSQSPIPPEYKRRSKREKMWKCPYGACDHGAFLRKQDLIRHFAIHYHCHKTCVCSIKFEFGGKYLYHRCRDGQPAKERWSLLRPDLERAVDRAFAKKISGSRGSSDKTFRFDSSRSRRKAPAASSDSPQHGWAGSAQNQLFSQSSPTPSEASASNIGLLPFPGPSFAGHDGSNIIPSPESFRPPADTGGMAPFQRIVPADLSFPPLLWDTWGSNAQSWDSTNQTQASFCAQ